MCDDNGGCDHQDAVVVMRRREAVDTAVAFPPESSDLGSHARKRDGKKAVKWSDSTNLREREKEYRRSQLNMSLDYHRIILEEQMEREGVKEWRSSLRDQKTSKEGDSTLGGRDSDCEGNPKESGEHAEGTSTSTDDDSIHTDRLSLKTAGPSSIT